jgi:hypothetical protein
MNTLISLVIALLAGLMLGSLPLLATLIVQLVG